MEKFSKQKKSPIGYEVIKDVANGYSETGGCPKLIILRLKTVEVVILNSGNTLYKVLEPRL